MANFDTFASNFTHKDNPKIVGAILLGVDSRGNEFYSKVFGNSSISKNSEPPKRDAVFRYGSMTKLVTSVALLQTIERGLIGLDDPVDTALPELKDPDIISWKDEAKMSFSFSKAKTAITPRHLLCHTSGLTYDELDTRIHAWRTFQDKDFSFEKNPIPISCGQPLSFEPDQGWAYGPSLDWASLLVRRLNGDITFEQYLIDNIWIPLGQKAPFPTFDLDKHLEYKAKVVQLDDHKASEHEKAGNPELGESPADEYGGSGLMGTCDDLLALLKDFISDSPKVLKKETVEALFTPQISTGALSLATLEGLRESGRIYEWFSTGDIKAKDAKLDHGLGGLIVQSEVPDFGQPASLILNWAGSPGSVWFASRELGLVGLSMISYVPAGFSVVKEFQQAWKKDLWTTWNSLNG